MVDEFQEAVCDWFVRRPDEANSDENGKRTEDWACDCDCRGEVAGEMRNLVREYEFGEAEGDGANSPRGNGCVRTGATEEIQHAKEHGNRDRTEERSVPKDDEADDSTEAVGGKRDTHTQGEKEQGADATGEELNTVAGTLAVFPQDREDIADYYRGDCVCIGGSHGHGMSEHACQYQTD
jgi:hypothetical protein